MMMAMASATALELARRMQPHAVKVDESPYAWISTLLSVTERGGGHVHLAAACETAVRKACLAKTGKMDARAAMAATSPHTVSCSVSGTLAAHAAGERP